MSYIITDHMHQRECVIADLQLNISRIISSAISSPEGVSAAEILIALNQVSNGWAREIYKQDVIKNDPINNKN